MEWNTEAHFYLPTSVLIQEKAGIDLSGELGQDNDNGLLEANIFLEDCMNFIKDFIINDSVTHDLILLRNQVEYLIASNTNEERLALRRAYVELVKYSFNDEGDLVGRQTGLNVVKGQITPLEELRGRRELSGKLERILHNSGLYYKGNRAWLVPDTAIRGTDY
jgi:hypothetical protein